VFGGGGLTRKGKKKGRIPTLTVKMGLKPLFSDRFQSEEDYVTRGGRGKEKKSKRRKDSTMRKRRT